MRSLLLPVTLFFLFFSCNTTPDAPVLSPEVVATPAPVSGRKAPDQLFGELFRRVQMERVFADGKTFVDMIPKRSAGEIMRRYAQEKETDGFDLKNFVAANFEPPASPESGFESDPSRTIGEHLTALWPVLTRDAGVDEGNAGSLIPLPNSYVVPGGRFREVYYWDSYFTMIGLRESGEDLLIREMVENFAYLVDSVGFIPNGNRTYYLTRSQPPFFSFMVGLLAEIEGTSVYAEFRDQLIAEYEFWMAGAEEISESNPAVQHVVRMPDGSLLNRYWDRGSRPRAESYREDVLTIRESGRDSLVVARHLRSGAESGWDYSARWFADGERLHTIVTTDIVPPDLNALLYNLELTISQASGLVPEQEKWKERANARLEAVERYLWNPESNWYEDYNFREGRFTGYLTLAGVYPLFVGLASQPHATEIAERLRTDFLAPGGLRTSLKATGQQWDAPNGWAPLQWMAYAGLRDYGYDALADDIRDRWMRNNERVYENVTKFVEKYNVEDITLQAGGGEYPVQDGFGWSNGVYLGME